MAADVTIVGAGVIALTAAVELGDRGVKVALVGTAHRGEASSAAAGMLAPSIEGGVEGTHTFVLASRDLYPEYLTMLEARTAIPVPLNRRGILRVGVPDEEMALMRERQTDGARLLDSAQIHELEPALGDVMGGVLYQDDGALDPLLLLDALRMLVSRHERIVVYSENVREVRIGRESCQVITDRENCYRSATIVLAAGAWTPCLAGLPRAIPIEPVRGEIVTFDAPLLRHVVWGERGYIVPRSDGQLLVGSTMERAGFVPETTVKGVASLREMGERLCPGLRGVEISGSWAGLRPVTPDFLPLLGADPEWPNVVYACGHSRNGILMAPATAQVVGDVVTGAPSRYDLAQFRPDRF